MIDINKKYKYRDGSPARILCIDRNRSMSVVTLADSGEINTHGTNGNYLSSGQESEKDLIEVVPLWEGEIRVHENGVICKCDPEKDQKPWPETGWRKVKAREVES